MVTEINVQCSTVYLLVFLLSLLLMNGVRRGNVRFTIPNLIFW